MFFRWILGCGALSAALVVPAAAQEWKPQKNVELIVSAGAGGAADRQARLLQRFLQAVPGIPSVTVNKLEKNSWSDDFRDSTETRKHPDSEYDLLARSLVELGVISR